MCAVIFNESGQAGLITLIKFIQRCNSVIFNLKWTVFQHENELFSEISASSIQQDFDPLI